MLLSIVSAIALLNLAAADCECGYTVNSTTSPDFALFTDLLETDFLHLHDITWNSTHNAGWIPQVYNVSTSAIDPIGKAAQLQNVRPNPLAQTYDWGGVGINGGDPGLQLVVSSTLITSPSGEKLIPMAEIAAVRTDMLYGSFRIGVKFTTVPGTCGAAFWYRNDSSEIDAEFLSLQQNASSRPINLVIQTPASALAGFDAASTPDDFHVQQLAFAAGEAYHEIRFDWVPGLVRFLVDGELLREFTAEVPEAPGHVLLNHWSNGNPGWSGGPPAEDAVMTVSYVKAYFNSSDQGRVAEYEAACGGDALQRTCQIPDQTSPPDPTVVQGNSTGKTYFFTLDANKTSGNQTIYPDASPNERNGGSRVGRIGDNILFATALVICYGLLQFV